MEYRLCTAEKPSVAKEIANVIGATKKCNGFYEGNGYRVTWAVGHLVGLAEPEIYGYVEQSKIWSGENSESKKALDQLPLFPSHFKLVVLDKTKKQFEVMKELMNDPDCIEIIDCGDAGAEGHILQWFIRQKAGCNKKVKRFIATSMTKEAIIKAMSNLHDITEYEKIIKGEFCKKKADWIMGMSMSRCASIIYNSKIDVGRVQSPTLYFVVQRYLAVQNFKPNDYYQLEIEYFENFKTLWIKDTNNLIEDKFKDTEGRLLNKNKAEEIAEEIKQLGNGVITKLESKSKAINRPQLYDITELERDGNRIFGYTADEVLQTAQSLYETHKIISYPRTDSRYITSDLKDYMLDRVKQIATIEKYQDICINIINKGLNIDKRIVDDEKVTDHHAIICTENIANYDISKLDEKERNILNLIITRMLVTLSDMYKYKETVVEVSFKNGFKFNAVGKITIDLGWKSIVKNLDEENSSNTNSEQLFKNIALNQRVNIKSINILNKQTTSPKLHTEATLLTAMENAGSCIENGAILKGKGIGTQATRASIIKSLFDKGYITNLTKGKTKYLIPTKRGINVIKVLPSELYSPKITADWEEQIAMIVNDQLTENEFMNKFKKFITEKIENVKNNKIEVDFSREKEIIGICPFCKGNIYEGFIRDSETNKKIENVYCENKECKFSIRKDNFIYKMRTQKNLTITQIKKLIDKGTIESKCVSKSNKVYNGKFILNKNEKGYAELRFEIDDKKNKKKL